MNGTLTDTAKQRARVTIHNADSMTDADRKRLAEWLRRTARLVTKKSNRFAKTFRATLYKGGEF